MPGNTDLRYHISRLNKNPQHISCRVKHQQRYIVKNYVRSNFKEKFADSFITVMIQSSRTERSGQPVQTQIRLLLEEQSDQGLHCLLFHLHLFDEIPKGFASFLNFRQITAKFSGIRKYRNFTVLSVKPSTSS